MALITPEYYAKVSTTLASSYTAGAGSISVSSATGFSTTYQFRVGIYDQTTGALKAVLKVTAISGTTLTTTSDGLDANCASGDLVKLTLTPAAMDQIRADVNVVGTYASLPATGMRQGDTYECTDAPYRAVYDGSNWRYFLRGGWGFGGEVFPPALLGSWNWDNQGSSTVVTTTGNFYLNMLHTSAVNGRGYYRAKTAPYTIIALIEFYMGGTFPQTTAATCGGGMMFRDASGKIVCMYVSPSLNSSRGGMISQKWTSTSSYNADYSSSAPGAPVDVQFLTRPLWWKFVDDSTNLVISWSIDGQNWRQFDTRGRLDFFASGSTGAGLFTYSNGGDVIINLLSWKES